jgi:hypothetical protein
MAEYHKETIRLKKLTGAIKKILKSKTKVNNLTNDGELETIYTLAEEVSSGSEFVLIPAGQESEYYTTSEINSTFEKISSYNAKKANKLTKSAVDDIATNNPSNVVYPPTITASVANPINPGSSLTLNASGAFSAFKEHNSFITYEWKLPDNSIQTGEYINFTTYTSDRGKSFTIYCTAIDAYGNRSNPANYVVNVRDNNPPLIQEVWIDTTYGTPLNAYDYSNSPSSYGIDSKRIYPYSNYNPKLLAYKYAIIWAKVTDPNNDSISLTFSKDSTLADIIIVKPFKYISSGYYMAVVCFKPVDSYIYGGTIPNKPFSKWNLHASDGIESVNVPLADIGVYFLNPSQFTAGVSVAVEETLEKKNGGLSVATPDTLTIPASGSKRILVYPNLYYSSYFRFYPNSGDDYIDTMFIEEIALIDSTNANSVYGEEQFDADEAVDTSSSPIVTLLIGASTKAGYSIRRGWPQNSNEYIGSSDSFVVKTDKIYMTVRVRYKFNKLHYYKAPFYDAFQSQIEYLSEYSYFTTADYFMYEKTSGVFYVVSENKPPYFYNISGKGTAYSDYMFQVADPEGKPVTVSINYLSGYRQPQNFNYKLRKLSTNYYEIEPDTFYLPKTLLINSATYRVTISDGVNTAYRDFTMNYYRNED